MYYTSSGAGNSKPPSYSGQDGSYQYYGGGAGAPAAAGPTTNQPSRPMSETGMSYHAGMDYGHLSQSAYAGAASWVDSSLASAQRSLQSWKSVGLSAGSLGMERSPGLDPSASRTPSHFPSAGMMELPQTFGSGLRAGTQAQTRSRLSSGVQTFQPKGGAQMRGGGPGATPGMRPGPPTSMRAGPPDKPGSMSARLPGPPGSMHAGPRGPPELMRAGPPESMRAGPRGPPESMRAGPRGPPESMRAGPPDQPGSVSARPPGPPESMRAGPPGPPESMHGGPRGPPESMQARPPGPPKPVHTGPPGPPGSLRAGEPGPLESARVGPPGPPESMNAGPAGPPGSVRADQPGSLTSVPSTSTASAAGYRKAGQIGESRGPNPATNRATGPTPQRGTSPAVRGPTPHASNVARPPWLTTTVYPVQPTSGTRTIAPAPAAPEPTPSAQLTPFQSKLQEFSNKSCSDLGITVEKPQSDQKTKRCSLEGFSSKPVDTSSSQKEDVSKENEGSDDDSDDDVDMSQCTLCNIKFEKQQVFSVLYFSFTECVVFLC